MRSLKATLGLAVMAFILSGCGGGSSSSPSASATSASSPTSTVASSGSGSGSTATGSGSGTGSSSGSGSGSGSSTGSAKLAWTAPKANTNGTALTNLAGYYIYYGTSLGSMSNQIQVNAGTVSYTVTNLVPGTWYFAVSAYTNTGEQSAKSNVGSKTIT